MDSIAPIIPLPIQTAHVASNAPTCPNVAELVDEWVAWRTNTGELGHRSAASVRSRLAGFVAMFAGRRPDQIGRNDLAAWQAENGRYSPSYRAHQLSALRQFFRWCAQQDLIDVDPTVALVKVRQPHATPRALTAGQAAAVLAAAGNPRDRAIVALELYMGLRCVEVARLDLADWDWDRQIMYVCGKGGSTDPVPVPDGAVGYLMCWLAVRGVEPGPLFKGRAPTSPADGRMSAGYVSMLVGQIMAAAGVHHAPGDGRTAHSLRHTAAADTLDACGDLRVVQAMLRHSSVKSTEIYLRRVDLDRVRRAMEGRSYGA